jgi:hypothetical protein
MQGIVQGNELRESYSYNQITLREDSSQVAPSLRASYIGSLNWKHWKQHGDTMAALRALVMVLQKD